MARALYIVFPSAQCSELWREIRRTNLWHLHTHWPHEHSYSHLEIGAIGEDLACQALKQDGYKVLYRNYQPTHGGEIDIICRHAEALVFVEVKTRVAPTRWAPADAVDNKKLSRIKAGAQDYLSLLPSPPPHRVDVVEVSLYAGAPPEIHIIADF